VAPTDARADQEIRACELSLEWSRNPEAYTVEELKDLNSKESDFSPAFGRDDFGVVYLPPPVMMLRATKHMAPLGRDLLIFLKAGSIRSPSGASLYR